ncbi:Rieske (2Fe-2S) protein [Trinickia fusca]|uniref:Rieske (2Fe-2S) protein n=2 Tax=Trinickia fusca TaxID=2419777 RepID=A0A494XD81_9BURK|nr:Rieske (2Fe-2S) protein [Trinickia fusca]
MSNESCEPIANLLVRRADARWWPVALSEQVSSKVPLGVMCDGEPVVLYRDATGAVRALEDRCRHRRAPLSLGRITSDGQLQCGYHGWTYDGITGICVTIPNLSTSERVPSHYAARAYSVLERDGFVLIRAQSAGDDEPIGLAAVPAACSQHFSGSVTVGLSHEQYVAALVDDPELLMHIAGLRITNYVSADPAPHGTLVSMERGVVWASRKRNHRFVTQYPWSLSVAAMARGALTTIELYTSEEELALWAAIGITPAARGTTAVLWRGGVLATAGGLDAVRFRLGAKLGRRPFEMRAQIDAHALARLDVASSRDWRQLLRANEPARDAQVSEMMAKDMGTIDG